MAATLAVNEPSGHKPTYTGGQIFKAWSPFLVLTGVISLWGIPTIKQALTGHYEGTNVVLSTINSIGHAFSFIPNVPLLNNKIINAAGEAIPAFLQAGIARCCWYSGSDCSNHYEIYCKNFLEGLDCYIR
ncbi:L-lactate permease [Peribacillus frigoritolerans]|nr:L-lactate permease [Peribacillus frigoritolerans]